ALRAATWAMLAASFVGVVAGIPRVGPPAFDESAHGFEALQIAESLRAGRVGRAFEAFVRPDIYPPLGRAALGLGFLFEGAGGTPPRVAAAVAGALAILLAARLARRVVAPERADAAAFWTVLFGATCGLGVRLARTAYLEPVGALAIAASA